MATNAVLITNVTGNAWMRASDGQLIALREGMRVPVDAHILTDQGASVTLQAAGVPPVIMSQNTDMLVTEDIAQVQPVAADNAVSTPADSVANQVLAALDADEDPFAILDPTAAVLGGGEGGGTSFTRLSSVIEAVDPLALAYPRPGVETPEFVLLGGAASEGASAGMTDDALMPPQPPQPSLPPTLDVSDDPDGDAGGLGVAPGVFEIPENMTTGGDGKKGSFAFTADGGLDHLTFTFDPAPGGSGTVPVTQDMLDQLAAGGDPIPLDTSRGLLHLTGYDAASGTVTYTYWSDGQQYHDQATNNNESVFDTITIVVTDQQSRTDSADLVANITDTIPVAQDDANSVTEGDTLAAVGNVILGTTGTGDDIIQNPGSKDSAYDDVGGYPKLIGVELTGMPDDAPAWLGNTHVTPDGTTFTIHGLYGDLVIHSDGSYVYTLADQNDALGRYDAVQELGDNDTPQEVFQYTITDADGDTAPADLTITVQGVDTPPTIMPGDPNADGAHVVVSEEGFRHANRDNGNGDYSSPAPDGDTTDRKHTHGTLTVGDPDTLIANLVVHFGDADAADNLGITATQGTGTGGHAVVLQSNKQDIHWKPDGAGGLIGYTGDPGVADSHHTVIEVRLNPNDIGSNRGYSVTLRDTLDHPVNQRGSDLGTEDVIDIIIPAFVSDDTSSNSNHIVIRIEDDSPHVYQSAEPAAFDLTNLQDFEGSLGVSVGADRAGSSVKIVSSDFDPENPQASSLNDQPVTVLLDGAGDPVQLMSGGEPLVYKTNPDGSVTAVTQGGGIPIFTVSGDALNGTYKVIWSGEGQIDPLPVGGEDSSTGSAGAKFVVGDKNVVTSANFGEAPVSVTLSGVTGNPGNNENLVYLKGGLLGVGNNHSIDGDPGHGGANGERLVVDFSAKGGADAVVTTAHIGITDLKKGESAIIQIAGSAQQYVVDGVSNNGKDTINIYITTSADQTFPEGSIVIRVPDLDGITQVQLGAGANGDYSVKSIDIEYETSGDTIPTPGLDLGLGAWVTDGDGDGAYADLPITLRPDANTGGQDPDNGGCDPDIPEDAQRVQNNLGDHGWLGGTSAIYGVEAGGNNLAGDYEVGNIIAQGTVDKSGGDDYIYGGKKGAGNNLYGDHLVSSVVASQGGDLTLNISGGNDALCDSDGSGSNLYGDFVQMSAVQAFAGDVTINLQGGSDTIQVGDGSGNKIYGDHVTIGALQSANGHQANVNITLAGNVIHGGSGDDVIYGDHVTGASQAGVTVTGGNDFIRGGGGSDTMWGGYGDDTFVWKLSDQGTADHVAVDTIMDFGTEVDHLGKDTLDLSDLLRGHNHGATPGDHSDLTQYLTISGGGGKTIIDVKVNADGTVADHVTQQIVIDNVDLTVGFGPDHQAALINSLIDQGKLKVDI